MGPGDLSTLISELPVKKDGKLLVGFDRNDDAAVYKLDARRSLVFTVDFFTPVVDDPRAFGRIAAANALSDVYAMGGKPFLALNLSGFPLDELDGSVFRDILAGAAEKAMEAGVVIAGGHSVKDPELKFGMAVAGFVDNKSVIDNSGARPGDDIIITKPIGTGVITTAAKRGIRMPKRYLASAVSSMDKLNDTAGAAIVKAGIKAATDITGFGLLGHAGEVAKGSGVDIEIYSHCVPMIEGAVELGKKGAFPGGSVSNRKYLEKRLVVSAGIEEHVVGLLCDAQTSGGMLIFCQPETTGKLVAKLARTEICSDIVGRVRSRGTGKIFVE